MKLFLLKTITYPWTNFGKIFFRGYFIFDDCYYSGESAVHFLHKHIVNDNFEILFYKLNGVFNIICEQENNIIFCVDRLRGLPLFYALVAGELWIGDDASSLVNKLPSVSLSPTSVQEYLSTETFVSGKFTLLNELFQVRAAEFCVYDKKLTNIKGKLYYRTEHGDFFKSLNIEYLTNEFWKAYCQTGKNLVKALRGRTAIIPLSGGADSRMVASMLKREGYEKVICYTYGRVGNSESELSRLAAQQLGYKWFFIPYTKQMWRSLRKDLETIKYEKFAFAYTSTPHIQDLLAVKYLVENELVPKDGVFVPGHSGDVPNGNHVNSLYLKSKVSKLECIKNIEKQFYYEMTPELEKRILSDFLASDKDTVQNYATEEEWFDTKERQAKFIINSVRVYEFMGHEWLIPLWDKEQLDFWKRVPLQLRYKRKLYYTIVNDNVVSTNTLTLKKRLAEKLRKLPIIHPLASRVSRMLMYWTSPLGAVWFISANEYFKNCFFGKSTFQIASITSQFYLSKLKEEINKHEKK